MLVDAEITDHNNNDVANLVAPLAPCPQDTPLTLGTTRIEDYCNLCNQAMVEER